MLKKLLPILLLLIGTGAGIGAGIMTAPGQKSAETHEEPELTEEEIAANQPEFIKLNNQFVVPLVANDRVTSMVVLSLSLETSPGMSEAVYAREPKLRDLFLRVLFDHANIGGFRGPFTQAETLDLLRRALREVAQKEMGKDIRDVLIVDIARQDT